MRVTGNNPPVKQPIHRFPYALREKVARLVDMLRRWCGEEIHRFSLHMRIKGGSIRFWMDKD